LPSSGHNTLAKSQCAAVQNPRAKASGPVLQGESLKGESPGRLDPKDSEHRGVGASLDYSVFGPLSRDGQSSSNHREAIAIDGPPLSTAVRV